MTTHTQHSIQTPGAPTTGARPTAMSVVMVTGPDETRTIEIPVPTVGPADVLIKVRACGICGSDGFYIHLGGLPGREGCTPLGHEPAGEVVEVGADVTDIPVGAHVVVNPMAAPTGVIGSGGSTGALADYLLIENAALGKSLAIIPDHVPFAVAALNEPMAVARHGVNRTQPKPGDQVVVFGAGPVGLGAVIAYKLLGASSVVVVDVLAARLQTALRIGADAVIDSSQENVLQRLVELHGDASRRPGIIKCGTDIYFDAAGVGPVIDIALGAAKHGATLGIVGVHKRPTPVDFGAILSSEVTIVMSMGYPSEIFEVTDDIVQNWQKYAPIISHEVPFDDVHNALVLARTPGAADKVVITMP